MGCGCNNNFKGDTLNARGRKSRGRTSTARNLRLPKEGENLESYARSIGYDINVVSGRKSCDCTCSSSAIESTSGGVGYNLGFLLKCKPAGGEGSCTDVCGKVMWDEPYGNARGVLNVEYYSKSQIQNDGVAEREPDCCSGDTCGATMYCPDGSSRHFEACCYGNLRCSDYDFNCSYGKMAVVYDKDLPIDKRLAKNRQQFSGFMGEEYFPKVNVREFGFNDDSYYDFNDKYSMYRGINKNDLITDF